MDFRNKAILSELIGVGLVVKDLNTAVKTYKDDFNVGPWEITEYNSKNVKDMHVYGEMVDCSYTAASTQIGETTLKLVQPLDDKSIFAEFLRLYGEGFHHITYKVNDFEMAKARFKDFGVAIAQSGKLGEREILYYNSLHLFQHIIEMQNNGNQK